MTQTARIDPIARETRALSDAMRADGFSDAYIARVMDEPDNAARLIRHYGIRTYWSDTLGRNVTIPED